MLWNLLAKLGQTLPQLGISQGRDGRRIELDDYFAGHTSRSPERMPEWNVKARQTRLIDGRHIRGRRPPVLRQDRISLDLASAHQGQGIRRLGTKQINLPRDQVLVGWRGATISTNENRVPVWFWK